ncbi:MAG: 50S ribosomal protein L17 [Rhodoluna sp.]|nr:50S ribosomal protein L17 [Rhodoluna sp.]
MPRPTKGPRLGGGPAHERLMLNNLASSLFTHKAVTTTQTKAKRVQPVAEKLVSLAKRGDLHARRQVMADITDKSVVHELFTNVAPLVQDRSGGYTRITKLGFRKGDNAPMALIELVLEPVTAKPARTKAKITNAVKATAVVAEVVEHTEAETVVDENIVEEAVVEAVAEAAPVAEEVAVVESPVEAVAEVVVEEAAPVAEEVAVVEEAPAETVAEEAAPAEEAAVAEAEAEAGDAPKADEA